MRSGSRFSVRRAETSRLATRGQRAHARQALVTSSYLLGLFDDVRALGIIDRTALACRIFGRQRTEAQIKRVIDVIRSWGYSRSMAKDVQWALCSVLLANRSPHLNDLNTDVLGAERNVTTVDYRRAAIAVSRVHSRTWARSDRRSTGRPRLPNSEIRETA